MDPIAQLLKLRDVLLGLERSGLSGYAMIPKAVPAPNTDDFRGHKFVVWPAEDYKAFQVAWKAAAAGVNLPLLPWPLGDGVGTAILINSADSTVGVAQATIALGGTADHPRGATQARSGATRVQARCCPSHDLVGLSAVGTTDRGALAGKHRRARVLHVPA